MKRQIYNFTDDKRDITDRSFQFMMNGKCKKIEELEMKEYLILKKR